MFGVAWKVTKVLFGRMNELEAPHGYYDGPLKELAARHLGLIKAVFLLLLVYLPVGWCGGAVAHDFLPKAEWTISSRSYQSGSAENRRYSGNYPPDDARLVSYSYAGFAVGKSEYEFLRDYSFPFLFFLFALSGIGLLAYRFYRLAKLLYPHLAFYFTLLVFVPFLNVLVILLLLWGALRQMRRRGLRVGIFGIDPARFE